MKLFFTTIYMYMNDYSKIDFLIFPRKLNAIINLIIYIHGFV